MEDGGRIAMFEYCKAQAMINDINRGSREKKEKLLERIKTCRSMLQDEMQTNKLTCVEVFEDNCEEPVYLRITPGSSSPRIDHQFIMDVFRQAADTSIMQSAEKSGHDLPRTLSHLLTSEIRCKHTKESGKSTISISKAKERGFTRESQANVTKSIRQTASDLLLAKKEMGKLKAKDTTDKKHIIEQQKQVEETVKQALRKADPVGLTTRVQITQEGGDWTYYLRCKEKESVPKLGIRKVQPLVEAAATHALTAMGRTREFTSSLLSTEAFWDTFSNELSREIDTDTASTTKKTSRLSLDRGAPRRTTNT